MVELLKRLRRQRAASDRKEELPPEELYKKGRPPREIVRLATGFAKGAQKRDFGGRTPDEKDAKRMIAVSHCMYLTGLEDGLQGGWQKE